MTICRKIILRILTFSFKEKTLSRNIVTFSVEMCLCLARYFSNVFSLSVLRFITIVRIFPTCKNGVPGDVLKSSVS